MFKKIAIIIGSLLLMLLLIVAGLYLKYRSVVNSEQNNLETSFLPGKFGKNVNPFIGTGGYFYNCINNFPGATLPFGMVRLSPDTKSFIGGYTALNSAGYYYPDNKIIGFSHTRLSGTGATDGGNFRVLPFTKKVSKSLLKKGLSIKFEHVHEKAFPGYYAVKLNNDVLAELTATTRAGIHRYTFPAGKEKHILLDVSSILGDDYKSKEGFVQINPKAKEVAGHIRSFGTFGGRYGGAKIYFVAHFNQPVDNYRIWNGKVFKSGIKFLKGDTVLVDFDFTKNKAKTIEFRLAISYVSIENARENLKKEGLYKSFDDLLGLSVEAWEEKLALIKIKGATQEQKTIFYTAMYRAFSMPTIFNDVNGQYMGFDKKVHIARNFTYYTDLSLWDTFRDLHSLYILIAPDAQRDMLISLVKMSEQGGALPRWPSGYGYTGSMIGSPADMVIAESYLKGIKDFDVETAYQSMKKTALNPSPKGSAYSGRRGIASYLKYGYCAADEMDEAVSKTMEYAWADDAISRLANALGYKDDAKLFKEHSMYYKNLWNTETQYFQPKNSDGKFVEKFKPLQLTYIDWDEEYTDDYVEGSALQWRYAVPFDAAGLIPLFKSKEYFVSELNDFFALSNPGLNTWTPGSYYWHGNEPDIYSAYLFNDAGRPDLTQKWVRWALENKYDTTYVGLDGNDDGATLSSWYIFSSLGLYPQAGSDIYQIGSPLFKEAIIKTANGKLTIKAKGLTKENIYVEKMMLNGSLINRRWLKHAEINGDTELYFTMGKGY
jgi:predicted alpha-1,2-mannosidase